MPTDSDRLLADGAPITLADGRVAHLRYGFRALKELEDEFGSVSAVQDAISTDGTGKQFGPLATVIRCGLVHERIGGDELLDLLDVRQLEAYSTAIGEAFRQAFPDAESPADADPKAGPAADVLHLPPGPGLTGTTPPPSSSDVATGTSG